MKRRKKRENLQYSAHSMYYAYAPICTNAVQWYIHAAWLQDMRMMFTVWTPKIIQIEYVRRICFQNVRVIFFKNLYLI